MKALTPPPPVGDAGPSCSRMGYTLLECVVVLGILWMLMNFVLSAAQISRERAWLVPCTSNMRQLLQAAKMYEADYGELPVHFPPGRWGPSGHWQQKVAPYVRDRRIFICPADRTGGATCAWGGWPSTYGYLYTEPWLGPNLEYREPAARSMLISDTDGHYDSLRIRVLGRYDGSVELVSPSHYATRFPHGFHFEPADGLGPRCSPPPWWP